MTQVSKEFYEALHAAVNRFVKEKGGEGNLRGWHQTDVIIMREAINSPKQSHAAIYWAASAACVKINGFFRHWLVSSLLVDYVQEVLLKYPVNAMNQEVYVDIEAKITSLENKLGVIVTENKKLVAELAELKERNAELEKQNQRLISENATLKLEKDMLSRMNEGQLNAEDKECWLNLQKIYWEEHEDYQKLDVLYTKAIKENKRLTEEAKILKEKYLKRDEEFKKLFAVYQRMLTDRRDIPAEKRENTAPNGNNTPPVEATLFTNTKPLFIPDKEATKATIPANEADHNAQNSPTNQENA